MTTIPLFFRLRPDSLKQKLLAYYFTNPHAEHYLRDLALKLGVDPANLSRDLHALVVGGIFRSRRQGKLKYFSLNLKYPLYKEIKAIIQKTTPAEFLSDQPRSRQVYVIAGPNGAGKTTFAKKFLPEELGLKTFINADLIAGGLSPFDVEGAALRARKLLLQEIENASAKGIDFAFETTLAGKKHVKLFERMIAGGYAVHVLFLWIPLVELSIKRVADRVRRGGHSIPAPVVRRRFHRGIQNLFHLYMPLLSSCAIYDNSGTEPVLIAYQEGKREMVLKEQAYAKIRKAAGIK